MCMYASTHIILPITIISNPFFNATKPIATEGSISDGIFGLKKKYKTK